MSPSTYTLILNLNFQYSTKPLLNSKTLSLKNTQTSLCLYKPKSFFGDKLPVVFYFHNGSFCVGSHMWPNCHNTCRCLYLSLGAVTSLDYRLALKHKLPFSMDDLDAPSTVSAILSPSPLTPKSIPSQISISNISGDRNTSKLSKHPLHNCAKIAAIELMKMLEVPSVGLSLSLHKGLPMGSGLRSSATSAVAAAVVMNELFKRENTDLDLWDL